MGRRRALQEEPRAGRSEETIACQKKADMNANSVNSEELLRPDQIKEEPVETTTEVDGAGGHMRVLGEVLKMDPDYPTPDQESVDGAIEEVALDLSQQRVSLEPEYEEALDLSTTKERREYRPEIALDLSKKSTQNSEQSSTTEPSPPVENSCPVADPVHEEGSKPPVQSDPEQGEDGPPEVPGSPEESSENSPPEGVSQETTPVPSPTEETSAPEFVCEICQKGFTNLTDLGKHTMDHVKAVKEQQARIKKAEKQQKKNVQQKKKQEKATQRSTVSSPLKEVPVLNTTIETTPQPPPSEKPLKPPKATATSTKTQKSQVLPSPLKEEQFQCHLCKTAFVTMRALGLHNRTHPKCKICNKQLADKDALRAHDCPEAEKKQKDSAHAKQAKLISWLMNAANRTPRKENHATVSKPPVETTDTTSTEIVVEKTPETPLKDSPTIVEKPLPVTKKQGDNAITAHIPEEANAKKTMPVRASKRRVSKDDKSKTDEIDAVSNVSTASEKSEKKAPAKKERKRKSPPRQVGEALTPENDTANSKSVESDAIVPEVAPKKRKRVQSKPTREDVAPTDKEDKTFSSKRKDKKQTILVVAKVHPVPEKVESVDMDRVSLTSGSSESAADENNPVPKKKKKTQQKMKWIQIDTIAPQEEESVVKPPAKKRKTPKEKEPAVENAPIVEPKQEPKAKVPKLKQAPPKKSNEKTTALSEIVPSQDVPTKEESSEDTEEKKKKILAPGRTTNPRGRPRKAPVKPLTQEDLTCRSCGNSFGNIGLLKNHIKSHRWQNPHICGSCGTTFKSALEVKEHSKLHNADKPFKCNECDSAFTRRFFLELHLRSHTGEKPFSCDLCNKAFAQSSQLKIHKRIHMGDKPNKCSVCDATFVMASKLKDHMRIHSGDRPYSCDQCGKTFAQAYYLKIHLRTHSGAKPFKCTVCGTGFRQSCHVVIHMRTHTKENPYACSDCGMTFRHSPVLKKHKETCEGKMQSVTKQEIKA